MKSLLLVLVALVAISAASQISEEAKRELEYKRNDTENRVRYSLRNAIGNALVLPLRRLDKLETYGKEDLDVIGTYGESDVVVALVYTSLNSWRDKMELAVAPFINHPEEYTTLDVDVGIKPPNPTWNDTQEYKKALRIIQYMVAVDLSILYEDYQYYDNEMSTQKLDEFTTSNFFKMLLSIIYEDTQRSIINSGQRAKYNVASGADLNNEFFVLSKEAYMARLNFNDKATVLVEKYKKNVSN